MFNVLLKLYFALIAVSSASLYGNVVDTYGLSAKGTSLGNAFTAGGDSAFAAQTNPATLTNQEQSSVAIGYQVTSLSLKDLSSATTEDASGLPASDYQASEAKPVSGSSFGLNLALSKNVHFGLSGYMPTDSFGKLTGNAPNEVNYLRSADRQQRPAIYTAAAIKFGNLSVGLGTYYTLKADGTLQMSLNNKASAARFDLSMVPVISPYGGLQWQQATDFGSWSAGFFYRAAQSTKSNLDTYLAVGAIGEDSSATLPLAIQTSLVPFYDPELIRIGFNVQTSRLGVYSTIEFARWSKFEAPFIYLEGEDITSLTERNNPAELKLDDTIAYKLGSSYLIDDSQNLEVRMGLEHHQSATRSESISGIVDPTRTIVAFGAGMEILKSQLPEGKSAKLDVTYQRSILSETDVGSDANTAVAGGYTDTVIGGVSYDL